MGAGTEGAAGSRWKHKSPHIAEVMQKSSRPEVLNLFDLEANFLSPTVKSCSTQPSKVLQRLLT